MQIGYCYGLKIGDSRGDDGVITDVGLVDFATVHGQKYTPAVNVLVGKCTLDLLTVNAIDQPDWKIRFKDDLIPTDVHSSPGICPARSTRERHNVKARRAISNMHELIQHLDPVQHLDLDNKSTTTASTEEMQALLTVLFAPIIWRGDEALPLLLPPNMVDCQSSSTIAAFINNKTQQN